jgi:hypothetical protein
MNIKSQVEYLQTYFNTKKIGDRSTKVHVSTEEVELMKDAIKINKKDGLVPISENFCLIFKNGYVSIKDAI